jgi:hypothetical protein
MCDGLRGVAGIQLAQYLSQALFVVVRESVKEGAEPFLFCLQLFNLAPQVFLGS